MVVDLWCCRRGDRGVMFSPEKGTLGCMGNASGVNVRLCPERRLSSGRIAALWRAHRKADMRI
jgi:hypothetical protein